MRKLKTLNEFKKSNETLNLKNLTLIRGGLAAPDDGGFAETSQTKATCDTATDTADTQRRSKQDNPNLANYNVWGTWINVAN